ncbi:MAG: TIGR03545 family protein [Helicobacteraceae bacterium]|jgi:uncharacterized protein (TIGR03545 family)/uncharacterized protein (TIGR03546 family)|nr:TIGR03545 family protein [Helicobacteraceae bacterium]
MIQQLLKIFKALNSSQSAWQVSLAAALGMFIGFTPVFAPHNLVIYLFAFLINVNLGVFIVSAALFGLLGYAIDPQIESLGYYILTLPQLEELFTSLYNNPWSILTSFNHTMVMGAFALSVILTVPLLIVLSFLIAKYRIGISKVPILRSMLAKPSKKRAAFFRWWGLLIFLALAVLLALALFFLSDRLIKTELENALSKPIGYHVTIDRLKTSLSPLGITIEGVQIPDSKDAQKNSVEIGHIGFSLDIAYLLHKKVLINELTATGIMLETDRKNAAVKEKVEEEKKVEIDKREPSAVETFMSDIARDIPDAKTLLKKEQLETKTVGEKTVKRLKEISGFWSKTADTKFNKKVYEQLKNEYKSLETRAKTIKNEKAIVALLSDTDAFLKKVRAQKEEYAGLIEQFESDRSEAKRLLKELADLPKEDFERLKRKYSFDFDGALNISEMILGNDITTSISTVIDWYQRMKPYIDQVKEIKAAANGEPLPKPERGKSRVVVYKEWEPKPKFWLKTAGFDLTTAEKNLYEVTLKNATENQAITKVPLTASAKSARVKGFDVLSLVWTHDRIKKEVDSFTLDWTGIDKKGFKKDKFFFAPAKLDLKLSGKIESGELDAKGKLAFRNTALGIENAKSEVEKILAATLVGINRFDIDMKLWDNPFFPKSSFSTDLDSQLKKRFKQALSARLNLFEAELKASLEAEAKTLLANAGASEAEIEALGKVVKGESDLISELEKLAGKNLSEDGLKAALKKKIADEIKAKQKAQEQDVKNKVKQILKR